MVIEHDDRNAGTHRGDRGFDSLVQKGGHGETLLAGSTVAINVSGRTLRQDAIRPGESRRRDASSSSIRTLTVGSGLAPGGALPDLLTRNHKKIAALAGSGSEEPLPPVGSFTPP
jgi:hypothetical protein